MHAPKLSPYSLINSHGKVHFGLFGAPVNDINVENADYRTPMNAKAGRLKKHFGYKRFQYFGGIANDLIFGCALADLRYVGAVFVYVYRISDKKMLSWQFKTPLAKGLSMTNRTDNGSSVFSHAKHAIRMAYTRNCAGERRKTLSLNLADELSLEAQMFEAPSYESMALCTPVGVNGWVYAQKTAALPITGTLKCAFGEFDLAAINSFGHHDFSAGYMRRETFWNWACFSGQVGEHRLGLNLSWGVNETGFSENCLWLDDKLHSLPQVQFRFDRDDDNSNWRIRSQDGRVDLAFTPEGAHKEKLNAWLLASNFKQFFGRFRGRIIDNDGREHHIENIYGFVEDQYSKW